MSAGRAGCGITVGGAGGPIGAGAGVGPAGVFASFGSFFGAAPGCWAGLGAEAPADCEASLVPSGARTPRAGGSALFGALLVPGCWLEADAPVRICGWAGFCPAVAIAPARMHIPQIFGKSRPIFISVLWKAYLILLPTVPERWGKQDLLPYCLFLFVECSFVRVWKSSRMASELSNCRPMKTRYRRQRMIVLSFSR